MTRLNRESSVMRPGLCAAMLLAAAASRAAIADQILEIHDDSLTTYRPTAASIGQAIRPLVDHRGVNIDGALRVGAGPPMSLAGNPFGESWDGNAFQSGMRLDTGTYSITDVDLALPAPGFSWVIGRSYNVRQFDGTNYYDSNGYQGKNWFQLSQPEIVFFDNDGNPQTTQPQDMVYLIYGADRFIEFKRKTATSNQFKAVNGAAGVMDFKLDLSGPDTYVYTDQRGWEHHFYGFDGDAWVNGRFWKTVAPGPGFSTYTAEVAYLGAVPGILQVVDSAGRQYIYTYFGGRLTKVEVSAGSPSQIVAEVHYSYYANGDLKLVTIKTPLTEDNPQTIDTKWLIRKKHYRYYAGPYTPTNLGNDHHLKYIIDFEGYRRYDWIDGNLNDSPLDVMDDNLLKPYASAYFEYEDSNYAATDKHRRITKAWFNGSCGCSGAGSGTYLLSYKKNEDFLAATGYDDEWYARTVLRQPDVQFKTADPAVKSYITQYFDETGQPLSRVLTDDDPSGASVSVWATQVVRGATDGLITSIHSPANVATYTHNEAGGDPDGSFTLSSGAGFVTVFARKTSGDLKGFLEHTKHRTGTGGSAFLDGTLEYTSVSKTVVDVTVTRPLVNVSWIYSQATTVEASGGSGPAGSYKTTFTHDSFHTGLAALTPKQITTTYNAVSTTNNGSGTATSSKSYMDEAGRGIWEKTTDGIINYWRYRTGDGQLEKAIEDADTGHQDFTSCNVDVPTDFVSSGAELHLVTCYSYNGGGQGAGQPGMCGCELDAEGNTIQTGTGPTAVSYTARLGDGRFVTLGFSDWAGQAGNDEYYGPVSYSVTNQAGQNELEGVIALDANQNDGVFTTVTPTSFIDEADADPITAVGDASGDIGDVAQMTTSVYSETGHRLVESRPYFLIPLSGGTGTEGTNYDATYFGSDAMGRTVRVKDPTGTIQRTVYDAPGRVTQQWLGTNDSAFAGGEAGADNMVKTAALEYDGAAAGGNSYLTRQTLFVQGDTSGERVTTYINDVLGRLIVTVSPTAPYEVDKYDNVGRVTATGLYSQSSGLNENTNPYVTTTNRLALREANFDELGRVFRTVHYKVLADGTSNNSIPSDTWYDAAGRAIKFDGEQLAKQSYDRLGRPTREFVLASDNDAGYADADDVSGDIVLQERQTVYESDDSDNVVMTATIDRYHDAYGAGEWTGALDDNADGGTPNPLKYTAADLHGRIQITASWFDRLDRLTDTVVFGMYDTDSDGVFDTFNRNDFTTPPARADDKLRTTYAYNLDGTLKEVTDPMSTVEEPRVTRFLYDAAGRQIARIDNYRNGAPSGPTGDDDVYTRYVYTDGLQTKMWVDLDGDNDPSDPTDQVTTYTYGVTTADSPGASKVNAGHLLRQIKYPDSGGTEDVVRYACNAQGEVIWTRDQEGNVIETDFDAMGRQLHRRVTALVGGFDGAVRRISATYDALGRADLVTQYDDATVGDPDTVVNEVRYTYDDWGNLDTFKQDHDSAIGAAGADAYEIDYTYVKVTVGRNTLRRSAMSMLPGGTALTYKYLGTGGLHDGKASRVTAVQLGTTDVAQYAYLGLDRVVGTTYLEPASDVRWVLFGSSGLYPGLDRFNRTASCTWTKVLGTPLDFYDVRVSYDRNSNVSATEDKIFQSSGTGFFDVKYTLDNLDRLAKSQWGDWNGSSLTNEKRETLWTLTQTGNWERQKLDLNNNDDYGGTGEFDDDRDHNVVNELTEREEQTIHLLYDKVGNLTDDGELYTYQYDAFGRLRKVKNRSTSALVAEYTHNGLGYRIGWHYDVDIDGAVEDDVTQDPWFFFAYDERWRIVAMYEQDDADSGSADQLVEQFVCHAAGLDGHGGSSSIDGVILRDRDANGDGTLEQRRYYCQNWRGDVVVLLIEAAAIAERAAHSDYGIPLGMPLGDTNGDGAVNVTDHLFVLGLMPSGYDIRADFNLDRVVDVSDQLVVLGNWDVTLGWGALSKIANRKGYAGYEFDPALAASYSFYHVRRRVLNADLGRWITRDPLGYVDGSNLYEYVTSKPLTATDPNGTGPKRHSCSPSNPDPPPECKFTLCDPSVTPCPSYPSRIPPGMSYRKSCFASCISGIPRGIICRAACRVCKGVGPGIGACFAWCGARRWGRGLPPYMRSPSFVVCVKICLGGVTFFGLPSCGHCYGCVVGEALACASACGY